MAVTVTALLSDITLGESTDSSYWLGTDGASTEIYRQGNASQGWIVSKNANESAVFDSFSKNGLLDMSGEGCHLYITVRCDIAPYFDYLRVGLQSDTSHGSSSNGTYWWTLVDNTGSLEWYGEWKTFVLDVNNTSTDGDSTGTLDLANITDIHFNVDNSNSGNIRSIENTYIDCIRFGTGLLLTGTSWDFDDVAAIDGSNTYKYDMVRKVGPGIFEVNGRLVIGDGATTTTPSVSNQTLFFPDKSTEGVAGGPLGKIADDIYKITITGTACTCDFNNVSFTASQNYPFLLDADYTGLASNSIDWDGGVVVQATGIYLDNTQSIIGVSFVDCGQIFPSSSEFEQNTIAGYTGPDAALFWPGGTTVNYCNFNDCTRGVEIDTAGSGYVFSGLMFNNCAYDVNNSSIGGDIVISPTNGSNVSTYINTGTPSGTTTINAPQITLTIEGAATGSEIRIYAHDTTTELGGVEDSTGDFDYPYAYSPNTYIDIVIHHVDYQYYRYNNYLLGASNSSFPVSQIEDRVYNNP